MTLSGVINLDKPAGISSAFAVNKVKRLIPRGTKIGHAGTLDPFATGVLLLLVGKATKLCEGLMSTPKQYEATVRFGGTTATDDPESPVEPWPRGGAVEPVSRERVEAAIPGFVGEVMQMPPAFSAMKVGGRRAYDLARKGQEVTLAARPVRIYGIEVLGYEWPDLRLRIDCGRGTYIRSIARDLGRQLGVGGYLTQLRRTRVGQFGVENAVTLEGLAAGGVEGTLVPVADVVVAAGGAGGGGAAS
jgi:tRNA pseudouridine55 synthase